MAYLRTIQAEGQVEVGFILGKAKLAPQSEPTIPRLELCAAVLAVVVAELIQDELDTKLNTIKFFCDSKLGSDTFTIRPNASTFMFIIESDEFVSPQDLTNGSPSTHRTTRLKTQPGQFLPPN